MEMHWLITSTTYGTWLPGDPRGSVTSVRDRRVGEPSAGPRIEHDRPGEAWEPAMPGLWRSSKSALKERPVWLDREAARLVCDQMRETARHREWTLVALAVMANHFHAILAGADSERMLRDLKAYASRALSRRYGKRPHGTWFTTSGSRRALTTERAVEAAARYVLERQPGALASWSPND